MGNVYKFNIICLKPGEMFMPIFYHGMQDAGYSGSRFTIHDSRFTIHGSRFTDHDSRLMIILAFSSAAGIPSGFLPPAVAICG